MPLTQIIGGFSFAVRSRLIPRYLVGVGARSSNLPAGGPKKKPSKRTNAKFYHSRPSSIGHQVDPI